MISSPSPPGLLGRRRLVVLSVVVLAVAAMPFIPQLGAGKDHRAIDCGGLACVEPLPVAPLRDVPDVEGFRGSLREGLRAYAAEDYPRAAEALGRAAALQPLHAETQLYLGSALLFVEHFDGAAGAFGAAAEHSMGAVRVEALWQSAQARLLLGHENLARGLLEELVDISSLQRRADAERQLEQLDG